MSAHRSDAKYFCQATHNDMGCHPLDGIALGLFAWIIFGALAGWITSNIAGTDAQQGGVMNIVLGIVRALVGGFVWGLLTGDGFQAGSNIGSLLVANLGGLIVSYAFRLFSR